MSNNLVNKYKNNYLSNVIIQLDYDPVRRFFENIPNDIIDKLKNDYIFHQNKISDVKLNIVTGARIETAIPVWEFTSDEHNLTVQFTQNFLKFNCTKYKTFNDLVKLITPITELVKNDVNIFRRVGVRYVNQIDLDEENPTEWTNYINEALISPINNWCDNDSRNNLARAMSQIMIVEEDYTLNFNYGIYNPIYPNKLIQKQYILDFDCYGKNIEYVDVNTTLNKFNAVITSAFEKSIKNPLREKMEVIND